MLLSESTATNSITLKSLSLRVESVAGSTPAKTLTGLTSPSLVKIKDISPSSSFRKEYHPGGEPGHKHGFQKARETLNIKPKRWMFTKDDDYKTAIDAWTAKNIKVKGQRTGP